MLGLRDREVGLGLLQSQVFFVFLFFFAVALLAPLASPLPSSTGNEQRQAQPKPGKESSYSIYIRTPISRIPTLSGTTSAIGEGKGQRSHCRKSFSSELTVCRQLACAQREGANKRPSTHPSTNKMVQITSSISAAAGTVTVACIASHHIHHPTRRYKSHRCSPRRGR